MHIIHNEVWAPKISQKSINETTWTFIVWPLPKWYWVTLWNSLRRVLLSTIPWTKVTWIKVRWVNHEYSTLPWIKDSVIDIMLNLKWLIITKKDIWVEWIKLTKTKSWLVTGADIKCPSWIEIINKDLYITEIDKNWLELDIDIRIEKWVWYFSIEDLKEREDDVEVLLLDTNFSPVESVSYEITQTRFWDITNLDTLSITVETNWAISASDALKFSWDMLSSYFSIFNESAMQIEWEFISDVKDLINREKEEVKEEMEKETYTPIEIMWLSPRTLNALINGSILSVEHLTKCTETKLSSIKWFWKKAMTEIRDSLSERWLKLLGDD